MSKKIKDNQQDSIKKIVPIKQNTTVSFEYEISNNFYLPDGITNMRERLDFYELFRKRLKFINSCTWLEFCGYRKNIGFEPIQLNSFTAGLQESLLATNIVSPDSKLDIIRIGNNYRVIGKHTNDVYYILAYDINFSAYDHG